MARYLEPNLEIQMLVLYRNTYIIGRIILGLKCVLELWLLGLWTWLFYLRHSCRESSITLCNTYRPYKTGYFAKTVIYKYIVRSHPLHVSHMGGWRDTTIVFNLTKNNPLTSIAWYVESGFLKIYSFKYFCYIITTLCWCFTCRSVRTKLMTYFIILATLKYIENNVT